MAKQPKSIPTKKRKPEGAAASGTFFGIAIPDPVVKPKTRTVGQIRRAVRAYYEARRAEQPA
jgi:hypothetical protein